MSGNCDQQSLEIGGWVDEVLPWQFSRTRRFFLLLHSISARPVEDTRWIACGDASLGHAMLCFALACVFYAFAGRLRGDVQGADGPRNSAVLGTAEDDRAYMRQYLDWMYRGICSALEISLSRRHRSVVPAQQTVPTAAVLSFQPFQPCGHFGCSQASICCTAQHNTEVQYCHLSSLPMPYLVLFCTSSPAGTSWHCCRRQAIARVIGRATAIPAHLLREAWIW